MAASRVALLSSVAMKGIEGMIVVLGVLTLAAGCGPGRGSTPATPGEGSVPSATPEPPPAAAVDAEAAPAPPVAQDRHEAEPEDPGPLPWADPAAMAAEVLTRCRGTDLRALVAISTEVNRGHAIAAAEGRPACEVVFGQGTWRSDAVRAWSGRVGPVRVSNDQAWAQFHELGDGAVAVVSLKREDERWRFDDLFNPPRTRFESWGEPL
jgi:hypothetical protein